jgi:hypothetical protein
MKYFYEAEVINYGEEMVVTWPCIICINKEILKQTNLCGENIVFA